MRGVAGPRRDRPRDVAATVVAAAACVVLAARDGRDDAVRAVAGVATALAVLSIVLVAIRIATPPSLGLAPNVEVTATVWAWIGLFACCLLAGGGALELRRPASANAEHPPA